MPDAGDVVTVDFVGARGIKRRPAVVLSSTAYHAQRPDVILGVLTTNIASATASTDYALQDWASAGLRAPTAFRAYFGMAEQASIRHIGKLSDRDREQVQERVRLSFF